MEICEKGEVFIERDDDLVFHHTKIILRTAKDEYFYAKTDQRIFQSPQIDIDSLDTIPIVAERVWPLADPKFTRAPEPLSSTCYLKRPSLLYYEDTQERLDYGSQILSEVEACELLRLYPHPNIAQYLGCVVKDGRIRALCFTKYSITLSQLLRDGTFFHRSSCLSGIEAGVRHMHALGLIHNDLTLSNIMMDKDRPIIIDFDSCRREGDKLGQKVGTFTMDGEEYARQKNDFYSLSKIRAELTNDM